MKIKNILEFPKIEESWLSGIGLVVGTVLGANHYLTKVITAMSWPLAFLSLVQAEDVTREYDLCVLLDVRLLRHMIEMRKSTPQIGFLCWHLQERKNNTPLQVILPTRLESFATYRNYLIHFGLVNSGLSYFFRIHLIRHKGAASKIILKLKPVCRWVQGYLMFELCAKADSNCIVFRNLASSNWIAIQNLFVQTYGNVSIALGNKVVECFREWILSFFCFGLACNNWREKEKLGKYSKYL